MVAGVASAAWVEFRATCLVQGVPLRMDVSPRERGAFAFGPFRLDPTRRTLHRDGREVTLTARLFDTLLYLASRVECSFSIPPPKSRARQNPVFSHRNMLPLDHGFVDNPAWVCFSSLGGMPKSIPPYDELLRELAKGASLPHNRGGSPHATSRLTPVPIHVVPARPCLGVKPHLNRVAKR